jgi:sialic acid synthase SpsE
MNINKNFIKINKTKIGKIYPTYFIADVAANHDGDFNKALDLIYLAREKGANAVKFQHFQAEKIVSNKTFASMKSKLSHQSNWKKSVFSVYKEASINHSWTPRLYEVCKKIGIDFFTSPYDLEMVDHVNKYVCAYKVGSGDITWNEILKYIANKKKPILIATGASTLKDVERAINLIKKINKKIFIMQCNTNYTGSYENFKHINLNVLKLFAKKFPNCILGLSDHTRGHSTVLGAIALGARVIEKHFTLSNNLTGPDHKFSMNPRSWEEMILRSRELELSLGKNIKKIEKNEKETAIVQRRSIHLINAKKKGERIYTKDIINLRPALKNSIQPYELSLIIGKKVKKNISSGEILFWKNLEK